MMIIDKQDDHHDDNQAYYDGKNYDHRSIEQLRREAGLARPTRGNCDGNSDCDGDDDDDDEDGGGVDLNDNGVITDDSVKVGNTAGRWSTCLCLERYFHLGTAGFHFNRNGSRCLGNGLNGDVLVIGSTAVA